MVTKVIQIIVKYVCSHYRHKCKILTFYVSWSGLVGTTGGNMDGFHCILFRLCYN